MAAGPIEIGLLIAEVGSFAKATGVGVSQSELYRNSIHAFVGSINAAGGVAGRKLVVIDHSVEVTSPDLASAYQAACTDFTQDHHVGAVIYNGVVYYESLNACLTKAGVPLLDMAWTGAVGDATELANNPGLIAINVVNSDRRLQSIINKALAAGFLRAGDTLGVFVEDCPYNLRAYDRTLTPLLARSKVGVVRSDTGCAKAPSDQGEIVSQLQAAALRFKTANVDGVMFVTAFESGYIYYFAQGAEQQQYAPQYLLFDSQGESGAMASIPKRQLVRMRGFGGLPFLDVTHPPAAPRVQQAVRNACLAVARGKGIRPAGIPEQIQVFNACDAVSLLRRALTLSGGRTGTASIAPAVQQVGDNFVSALNLNGATRFGRDRHDGMELTAVSVYQAKCECFVYRSAPTPIR